MAIGNCSLLKESKIILGAVQFGCNYGVSNKTGKTPKNEVEKILRYAYKHGINMLDTAPSYGESESVIGQSINNECWRIITKTPHFKNDTIGESEIDELLKSFKLSQKRLGKEVIDGMLIHNCDNIFLPGGEKILKTMEKLKRDGMIKKIGVSLYRGKQIDCLLDNYSIDFVQLPINILDQRLIHGGQLSRLKKHGVEIHARSVFLQGLLLMQSKDISPQFNPMMHALNAFHKEAKEQKMSALRLALGFVQNIDKVDKIVIGVNTLEHMREIVNSESSTRINIDKFSNLSASNALLLNPSNWRL